jgi:flagellar biosynthesis component FlhA
MINRKYVKVEGHPNLVRDVTTNAILNADIQSSNSYTHKKNKRIEEKEKLQSLTEDVINLKTDLSEIKTLLRKLLNES